MTHMFSKPFTVSARIEMRGLNVQATFDVYAASGKGVDSGWSKLKDGMRALGFRFGGDEELDPPVVPRPQE